MRLSIVITHLKDPDIANTVRSIKETAGERPEIIIVNDGGEISLHEADRGFVKVFNNERRIGVGPSRHVGILRATGDYVMVIDSHMRFTAGWYPRLVERMEGQDFTLACFACLGLDSEHMDPSNPKSIYYGATWNVFGKDPNWPVETQVMEAVWNKSSPGDFADIPCVMGGAYIASKNWFLTISGLNLLRQWGEDETILSLRSWMFGGDVKLISDIGIGHKFLLQFERQPYEVNKGYTLHNKLVVIHTLLPKPLREFLLEKLTLVRGGGELSTAKALIHENWHLIEVERAFIERQARCDFYDIAKGFNIPLPV